MSSTPFPSDEDQRLEALRRYDVLDTPPELAFDRITRLAARLLHAPTALVSLVDAERQWFKSCCGLDISQTPRAAAFCAYTILENQVMVVPDATRDARFAENPLVTGPPHIRFYAGAPLRTPDGFNLGALCVVDTVPRTLGEAEQGLLADLAAIVVDELELRLAAARLEVEIAERERLRALAESEKRFRALAEGLGEGLVMTDPQDVILYANARMVDFAGWSREELIGRPAYELLLPPEQWPILWARNERRCAGMAERYDAQMLRKDGTLWWGTVNATPLRDTATDRVVGTLAAITDITESKRIEAERAHLAVEMEDQRRRLDTLIASVPGVVWEMAFPPEGKGVPRCTFVSDYVEKVLGWTAADLLARDDAWLRVLHPRDREYVLREIETARREDTGGTLLFRWLARDGRMVWGETHAAVVHDASGAVVGLRGVALDVTEDREAEERLRESEARYRLITDAMDDVVSLHDPEGRFLYASPSITRLMGYTVEEAVGLDDYALVHPDDRERFREQGRRIAVEGKASAVEWRQRRKDGSYIWLETRLSPIYDERGRLHRLAALSRDITERKRAEEALAYRFRLEALITELSAKFVSHPLSAVEEGIDEALRLIGEFTGVDRSYVFQLEDGGRRISNTHEWCAPGISAQKENLQNIEAETRPWLWERLRRLEVVHIPRVADLPPESGMQREYLERQEIRSLIIVPMALGGAFVGFVGLDSVRAEKTWPGDVIALLRIVGDIFAGALERKRTDGAVREKINDLQLLQALHEAFQGVLDLPIILARIHELLPRRLGVDRARILLYDPERNALVGSDPDLPPPEGDLSLQCFTEARPLVVEEYDRSAIALPLLGENQPIGALRLDYTGRSHMFPPGEIAFLSLVARQLGIVIHNARLFAERERALDALRETEKKYRSIFENATEGIFQSTPEGRLLSANPALARISGYDSPEEMIRDIQDVGQQIYVDPARRREFARRMREEGEVQNFETQARRKDGTIIWISQNARAVRDPDSGKLLYFEGTFEDITARKAAEDQLRHDAFHDRLTDLPNRTLFLDRLAHQIERGRRDGRVPSYNILYIDFDRFKVVNDSLGHRAGDETLSAAARRLKAFLQPGDTLARLGGDEFAILQEDSGGVEEAAHLAQRIQGALAQPFDIGGHTVFLPASIGVAPGCPDYEGPEDLLRDASTAMHRAKSRGGARHAIFDSRLHARGVDRLQLETDLRQAVERRELRVFYQPIVSLQTGRIGGTEALMRWERAGRGLVPPDEFVAIAEETGVIVRLGGWLLGESCRQMRAWQERFPRPGADAPFLSVNLSSRQFSPASSGEGTADLSRTVDGALRDSGLEAHHLHLEITESVILESNEAVAALIADLHARGVHFAMDDFGTGYSSLSYLHRFPITLLKIDRSFIRRVENGDGDEAIVRAIVTMAHSLGVAVVAEGIETPGQLARVRAMGCEYGQGYLFSPPLGGEEMETLFARDPRW